MLVRLVAIVVTLERHRENIILAWCVSLKTKKATPDSRPGLVDLPCEPYRLVLQVCCLNELY